MSALSAAARERSHDGAAGPGSESSTPQRPKPALVNPPMYVCSCRAVLLMYLVAAAIAAVRREARGRCGTIQRDHWRLAARVSFRNFLQDPIGDGQVLEREL